MCIRDSHLIEQRLEQVEVAAVDEGDFHRRIFHGMDGIEAAKAAADNDNLVFSFSTQRFISLARRYRAGKRPPIILLV